MDGRAGRRNGLDITTERMAIQMGLLTPKMLRSRAEESSFAVAHDPDNAGRGTFN